MRRGPCRLPLIALGALGALIALILVGTYIYRESRVLVDVQGSGPGGGSTAAFAVARDWDLQWSYDCSPGLANQLPKIAACDFVVTVWEMSNCQVSARVHGIIRHGAPDLGVIQYQTGGTFYLVVQSYGSWAVTVTGSGSKPQGGSGCSEA